MAQHNNTGFWGEQLACDYLISHGYHVLHRNHRIGRLELDLVVQHQNNHRVKELIIVEVKTRSTAQWQDPLRSVTFQKQKRLMRAANQLLQRHYPRSESVRFDIIVVVGSEADWQLTHVKEAFYPF